MNLKNTLFTITWLIFGSRQMYSTCIEPFNKGVSSFATNLYQEVIKTASGDLIISPFSAQTILSVALQGAVGLTAQQMIAGLQFAGLSPEIIAKDYRTALAPVQNNPSLRIANKLYLQQGYSTKDAFNYIIAKDFYTSAEMVNFAQSVSAANKINRWVSSETNNTINNLISPKALSANTKMVLVNAIYFKGTWTKAFKTANTYNDTFNTDSSTCATIPFMHITDTFQYAQLSAIDAKVIQLKYVNSTMSMIVILPNDVDGLTNLENNLNKVNLQTFSSQLNAKKVYLSLPKFNTTFSVTLKRDLSNLGMTIMFTNDADFSDMLQQAVPLDISSVVQKAYIQVNEEGTTAAAATGITFTALALPETPVLEFNANHPFIYFLQEGNKYPYFIGRFMNKAQIG